MLWHDADDVGAITRAIKAGEYVVAEGRAGRNVLVRAAEAFSAEPWRDEWWKTAESGADALTHAKSVSGKSPRCAVMTTYVDDFDLGANWEFAGNRTSWACRFVRIVGAGTSKCVKRKCAKYVCKSRNSCAQRLQLIGCVTSSSQQVM